MALSVADRAVHPLTADQALAMLAAGIIPEDNRLELLDGVLTEKPVKSPEHETAKHHLLRWLDPTGSAGRYEVLVEHPLRVPDMTALPEPDLLVIVSDPGRSDHPRTGLLVVEVAVSSHEADLVRKPDLYAAAGVPEYWVVDVPARRLVRHQDPRRGRYQERQVLEPPATLRPTAVDAAPLALGELLAVREA